MFTEQDQLKENIQHIFDVFTKSECEIRPHFWLTGKSGTGKSYLVQSLAKEMEMPTISINAAQLTGEGYSGNSLSKALRPLKHHWDKPNVIFVDEFDKLFQRNGEATMDTQSNVQDEFLQLLESDKTSVFGEYGKYDQVAINKSLFVFAGAFSNQEILTMDQLRETGMRNEFVGRVPIILGTPNILLSSMLEAIPHMKIFKDYIKLFPKVKRASALKVISTDVEASFEKSNIGIRYLNYAIHKFFMECAK